MIVDRCWCVSVIAGQGTTVTDNMQLSPSIVARHHDGQTLNTPPMNQTQIPSTHNWITSYITTITSDCGFPISDPPKADSNMGFQVQQGNYEWWLLFPHQWHTKVSWDSKHSGVTTEWMTYFWEEHNSKSAVTLLIHKLSLMIMERQQYFIGKC